MVHFISPYRTDKDLGRAYNEAMALIPDGDAACITDYDTMFLLPDQPAMLIELHDRYPNAVLTCLTNRISNRSKQLYSVGGANIEDHIEIARTLKELNEPPMACYSPISGFLMVVPKSVWKKVPFAEGIGCLGVDTRFSRQLLSEGIPILICQNIYIWHTYRLGHDTKNHLL